MGSTVMSSGGRPTEGSTAASSYGIYYGGGATTATGVQSRFQ
jgi:hypothetical protein